MNKKTLLLPGLFFLIFATYFLSLPAKKKNAFHPQPTIIKEGEEEGNQDARQQWFHLMHSAAPGTDWKAIELGNSQKRHQERIKKGATGSVALRGGIEEEIIPAALFGEWKERGSKNQAGCIFATEYDSINNKILAISGGGTLWQGNLDGSDWIVINQDLQFNSQLLQFIQGPNGRRLLALSGRVPHYSDDGGYTWTASTGINYTDNWGGARHPIVLKNESHYIYIIAKPDYWTDARLYKSIDKGETFNLIQTLNTSTFDRFALCNPHGTNEVYLAHDTGSSTRLQRINQNTDALEMLSNNGTFNYFENRTNLAGIQIDTLTRLYAYNTENLVFQTDDFGLTWTEKGDIGAQPWGVGLYVSPSNPDFLITGGFECYYSHDGGNFWNKANDWGDYYGDIDYSLHADMMYFEEFSEAGTDNPFMLISNHGGLSISWDDMATTLNIGKEGLNVGQFYDVDTDPLDPRFIYAGSQDQGFQRGFASSADEVLEMDQIISGDYGHTVFAQGGSRLWTVYPGGWVTLYNNPQTNGGPVASWEVDSENESVWIPPLLPDPDPTKNIVYLAGGSVDGGPGSYIIALEGGSNTVVPAQLFYDFKAESGGEVSALAISPLNENLWYAATTNGRFFTSTDRGENWEQMVNFLPEGHYLYGSTIYPSRVDTNTVYFGGSGYSNPAVYKSTDQGDNWNSMADGLPNTLVFEIRGDENDLFLFAGTENGPYVYYTTEDKWYDLAGTCAPTQSYWSVEYLEAEQIARFGTYGRGVWDFQITQTPVATEELIANAALDIYPNPSKGLCYINLTTSTKDAERVQVTDMTGKVVFNKELNQVQLEGTKLELDLTHLPKGGYVVSLFSEEGISSRQIVLQ
ncbi:MAG: hypothetical protein ACI956_001867 [Nonlabens sp.]|jgi:hypothetical protein